MGIDESVHAIESLGIGRAYVYQEQDRLTLIDTGLGGSADKIFAVVEKIGRKPEDIRQIFITHHHGDHIGSLAEVIARSNGAQVLAHKLDAPVIRGDQPPPMPKMTGLRALLKPLTAQGLKPAAEARVDRELEDGDQVDVGGGAKVLHVPGHTAGSIALYIPKQRILFSGDAAVRALGLGPPSGLFGIANVDREQATRSFIRLAELDFDRAFFGHGKPLDGEASALFRRAADQLD
ncbi:MAG: MBL fold metallo-hydrolase [Chloroflexi bacterium]|nr:MBL fold metallo-hydrolase [Chloroflexota bacterium]